MCYTSTFIRICHVYLWTQIILTDFTDWYRWQPSMTQLRTLYPQGLNLRSSMLHAPNHILQKTPPRYPIVWWDFQKSQVTEYLPLFVPFHRQSQSESEMSTVYNKQEHENKTNIFLPNHRGLNSAQVLNPALLGSLTLTSVSFFVFSVSSSCFLSIFFFLNHSSISTTIEYLSK